MTPALIEFGEFYPDPVDVEAVSTMLGNRRTLNVERAVMGACARGDLIALAAHNAALTASNRHRDVA